MLSQRILVCIIFSLVCSSIMAMQLSPGVALETYQEKRDLEDVKEILQQSYADLTYEALGEPEGTTQKFLNSPKFHTVVCRDHDKTVGFINYQKPFKQVTFLGFIPINIPFQTSLIHLLGVNTRSQRKGYGEKLMQYALDDLKKDDTSFVILTTKVNNDKSRRLYERLKFECNSSLNSSHVLYTRNLAESKQTASETVKNFFALNKPLVFLTAATTGAFLALGMYHFKHLRKPKVH